ncbi:MAG: hypothetical protein II870_07130, partial [Synergistaceae bacterium]|nr:hypothetical protein [Synergistaceae bacterium]
DGRDLLDIFDNFYAMQNGPVESDIYNAITSDQLTYYSFINFSLEIKKLMSLGFSFEDSVRSYLKKMISTLGETCSEEYFEYLVQQAIEDKEWLLR